MVLAFVVPIDATTHTEGYRSRHGEGKEGFIVHYEAR